MAVFVERYFEICCTVFVKVYRSIIVESQLDHYCELLLEVVLRMQQAFHGVGPILGARLLEIRNVYLVEAR